MKKIFTIISTIAISLITIAQNNNSTETNNQSHEYVDLGLSVKWATCNIGADSPEDYGYCFAWGEIIADKGMYLWRTYKHNISHSDYYSDGFTKYCTKSWLGRDGFEDNKTNLEQMDDAAHISWGGKWRIPTESEFKELKKNCTWTWTSQNDVNGYLVTSNIEGYTNRSIFLPAAGLKFGDYYRSHIEEEGYYWTSSLPSDKVEKASCLAFFSEYIVVFPFERCYGLSIRPIHP